MPDQTPDPTPDPTAEAPEPPEPTEVSGRDRLLAALRRPPSRGQLVAGALLAVLGFGAVVQVQSNDRNDTYVGARQSDLITLINNLSLASQRTQNQITRLENARTSLRNDTESARTAVARARQQADELGILAGTLPAYGPGVRILVRDPSHGVGTDQLLNGLEELRDAGAEAMEINDKVRVVAQTWVRDDPAGGVVVDGTRLRPPYSIDAVGDPHTLTSAVHFPGGFGYEVRQAGGSLSVQTSDAIEVASLAKPTKMQYAKPASKR